MTSSKFSFCFKLFLLHSLADLAGQCTFSCCVAAGIGSGVTPANQTKERPVHELLPGANWNQSSM